MVSATEEETMEVAPAEVTTSETTDTQTLKEGLKLKETIEDEPVTTSEDTTPTEDETSAPVTTSEDTTPVDETKSDDADVAVSDDIKTNGEDQVEPPKEESKESNAESSKPEETKPEETKPEETKEEIVARFEEEFKERYTENDPAHKAVQDMKEASPPVMANFGSRESTSSSTRTSSREERSSSKRTRSRSRSKSSDAPPPKRKGAFGYYSYFVFYY